MPLDYVALRSQIQERIKVLSPNAAQLTQDDLRQYFIERLTKRSAASEADAARSARADRIGLGVVSVASLGAVGSLIAAGPIAAPAVGAVAIGAAGYATARAIANTVRGLRDRDQRYRTGALLQASLDEQRREYERDQSGGFFKRLYRDVADRFKRHGATIEQLNNRIDHLQVPRGETYASAVQQEIDRVMTPEITDFVNRTALDRHSASARLLARLSTIADLSAPGGELRRVDTGRSARGRAALAAMGIGSGERGVLSPAADLSAQQLLGVPRSALPAASPASITYYGYIRTSEPDREFLASFGLELGPFNAEGGCFNVKASPAAFEQIAALNGAIGTIEMYPLSDAIKAPDAVTAKVDLDKLSETELSAYGAFVVHATVTDAPPRDAVERSRRASLVAAGHAVADEWERRRSVELVASADGRPLTSGLEM
ncbi:hypothetical protein LA345_36645 (plasmid) [Burkholderia vietnamiensis]|uniref:Uncharacterized protein n=1 Tax=Burkholderia vietnamiensis (strain G4 / LMG 22486) TaxID=269482 RepID=A4JVV0_BURVG|nr:hypothetical protein Bcep1808_7528 [Burkholderia vietnamiensis G4]MCB4349342.1 hypothetical protein [Burkholderia vietnamiensis]